MTLKHTESTLDGLEGILSPGFRKPRGDAGNPRLLCGGVMCGLEQGGRRLRMDSRASGGAQNEIKIQVQDQGSEAEKHQMK